MGAIVNDLIDRYGIENVPAILDQGKRIRIQVRDNVR
jgi:hypothetical protein